MNKWQRIKGVVFDLDDTLYFEDTYVHSGFRVVAQHLAHGDNQDLERIFSFCWDAHLSGQRGHIFDDLCSVFDLTTPSLELVRMYREHIPNIRLEPEVSQLIQTLKTRGFGLGLITDGALVSQRAKVAALGLRSIFNSVICTDEYGRDFWKPHCKAFEATMQALSLPAEALVYVADNPEKDFVAPRDLGWLTVRFKDSRQLRHEWQPASLEAQPHHIISSLHELETLLSAHV
jgi:putative hydrolase of the HAD superfamily